jgi:hypothetical protein
MYRFKEKTYADSRNYHHLVKVHRKYTCKLRKTAFYCIWPFFTNLLKPFPSMHLHEFTFFPSGTYWF